MRDTLPTELEMSAADPRKALLQVAEAIALHRDLPALFRDLAQRLPAVAPFDFIGLVLHDPAKHVMRVHVLETAEALGVTTRLDGMEIPMEESASGWVWTHQQPLLIPSSAAGHGTESIATLEAAERDHIMWALQADNWTIGGPNGTAVKLGRKRTTLQSKMHKFAISCPS